MDAQTIVYIFGIALTLSAVFLSHLGKAMEAQLQNEEVVEEIEHEFDCEQLRGKIKNETLELLLECRNIMNSDIIRRTKEYMLNLTREEMQELKTTPRRKNPKFLSRKKRSEDCPVVDNEFLTRHAKNIGMRSLSPYKEEFTIKNNRFPRFMLKSVCLCDGCINPSTGRETMDLVSKAVEVKQRVYFYDGATQQYEPGEEKLPVACTCIQPVITSQ